MEKKLLDTLKWITNILKKHDIQYQISGGLAAHVYGAQRPINDIDIDMPEDAFDIIYDEIKEFIIFGPAHYKDDRWDLELVTLNYHGQEIDIGGASTTRIYDDIAQKWIQVPVDLSKTRIFDVHGIKIPIHDPYDLIEYKKLLQGNHQKSDIEAIANYVKRTSHDL